MHPLWKERAARGCPIQVHCEPVAIAVEERHASERGDLERRAQRDAQVSALDLPQRRSRDASSIGEVLLSPTSGAAGKADLLTEQASSVRGVG